MCPMWLFKDVSFKLDRPNGENFATVGLVPAFRMYAQFQRLAVAAGIEAHLGLCDDNRSGFNEAGKYVLFSIEALLLIGDDPPAFAFICAHELAHLHHKDKTSNKATELRADRTAIEFMRKAGFDTSGAIRALKLLPPEPGDTHPSREERIEAISRLPEFFPSFPADTARNPA